MEPKWPWFKWNLEAISQIRFPPLHYFPAAFCHKPEIWLIHVPWSFHAFPLLLSEAFSQHLLHPGVQHKFFALEGLTCYSSHNESASGRCGNTKEGPSIHLRVIVSLISRNLLVDWLHAKAKRECPERGEHTDLSERAMTCHTWSRGTGYLISGRNHGWG